jgi:hypothetical protein
MVIISILGINGGCERGIPGIALQKASMFASSMNQRKENLFFVMFRMVWWIVLP